MSDDLVAEVAKVDIVIGLIPYTHRVTVFRSATPREEHYHDFRVARHAGP